MKWSIFGVFGQFHFTPKWDKMADHFTPFGTKLVKFESEMVKFTNNSKPNLPHDRIKKWVSKVRNTQNTSEVFKSNFYYYQRVAHTKLF
jgi:hypothetical protein